MSATSAAIDIGGTKMLAQIFAADMQIVNEKRIATPQDYTAFVTALADLWAWARAAGPVPIGISLAGFVDPITGIALASNIPITGKHLARDLQAQTGEAPVIINDCDAFALSEAVDGAGAGAQVMIGLIMGTGMAAGLCENGQLAARGRAQAVEIGHVGMPARALMPLGLGLRACGCGQTGCIERYVTGRGLTELAQERVGESWTGEDLAQQLDAQNPKAQKLFAEWCELVAEALSIIHMMNDPQVIVIGGGLSALPGLLPALTQAFARHGLPGTPRPELRLAQHGGASGTRGAAFVAQQRSAQC